MSVEAAVVFIACDGERTETYRDSVTRYTSMKSCEISSAWSELRASILDGVVAARGNQHRYILIEELYNSPVYKVVPKATAIIPASEVSNYELHQNGVHPEIWGRFYSDDWTYNPYLDPRSFTCWENVEINRQNLIATFSSSRTSKTTQSAETKCEKWLFKLMSSQPNRPTASKKTLESEALENFSGLSKQGFKRARQKAIERSGATAWSAPGRPKNNDPN